MHQDTMFYVPFGGFEPTLTPEKTSAPHHSFYSRTKLRAQSTDLGPDLHFKTNCDEKYCLSSEIECLKVEDYDFSTDSLCNLHMEIPSKSSENQGFSEGPRL